MREYMRVIIEGLVIAVVGSGIALVANAKNPTGLVLSKDYFAFARGNNSQPSTPMSTTATAPDGITPETSAAPVKKEDPSTAYIRKLLRDNGLSAVDHAETAQMFQDPGYASGLYLFLDARSEHEYTAGHIPGAYHLYAFLKDDALKGQILSEFIPLAMGADKVVIYCGGGECDDSVQVALELPMHGLDPAKILVDVDGFTGWKKAGMPYEKGVRLSGDIVEGTK